jgi:hypothetical protein
MSVKIFKILARFSTLFVLLILGGATSLSLGFLLTASFAALYAIMGVVTLLVPLDIITYKDKTHEGINALVFVVYELAGFLCFVCLLSLLITSEV